MQVGVVDDLIASIMIDDDDETELESQISNNTNVLEPSKVDFLVLRINWNRMK
jgi:hypothetical protein